MLRGRPAVGERRAVAEVPVVADDAAVGIGRAGRVELGRRPAADGGRGERGGRALVRRDRRRQVAGERPGAVFAPALESTPLAATSKRETSLEKKFVTNIERPLGATARASGPFPVGSGVPTDARPPPASIAYERAVFVVASAAKSTGAAGDAPAARVCPPLENGLPGERRERAAGPDRKAADSALRRVRLRARRDVEEAAVRGDRRLRERLGRAVDRRAVAVGMPSAPTESSSSVSLGVALPAVTYSERPSGVSATPRPVPVRVLVSTEVRPPSAAIV